MEKYEMTQQEADVLDIALGRYIEDQELTMRESDPGEDDYEEAKLNIELAESARRKA